MGFGQGLDPTCIVAMAKMLLSTIRLGRIATSSREGEPSLTFRHEWLSSQTPELL